MKEAVTQSAIGVARLIAAALDDSVASRAFARGATLLHNGVHVRIV